MEKQLLSTQTDEHGAGNKRSSPPAPPHQEALECQPPAAAVSLLATHPSQSGGALAVRLPLSPGSWGPLDPLVLASRKLRRDGAGAA